MNKILKTSIAFLALASSVSFASLNVNNNRKNETIQIVAKDKSISDSSFVRVDNFLYSGKGFLMEFEYTLPNKTTTMPFSLMNFGNNWHRLTETFYITFNSDGTISTPIGHIFEIDGHHYFELMFADLTGHLNNGANEAANGTETVDGFYIREDTVEFNAISTVIISTDMNAYPVSEIRNSLIPGLTFKAFTPKLVKDARYGMMIVPSSYIKGANGDYKHHFDSNNIPYIDLECNPSPLQSSDPINKAFGSGYSFKGSIASIKEDNYQIPFVAIPYYELNSNRVYSNFIRNTKSSYYDKCKEFRNSAKYKDALSEVKEEVNNVIYKCEHHIEKTQLGDIKAYFKSNTEKVYKSASLPGELVTKNVMYSAKNENERGQVIINVPFLNGREYFASFEPFVNTSDPSKIISQDNIKIEQQLYQNVLTNWSVGSSQPTKWYPDGKPIYNLPLGYVPDALLPFDVAFDSKMNVLSGEDGPNNALSYTISVPKDAASGEYKSKIVIKISGSGTLALPVTLNVFDFTLPDENKAKQIIIVNTGETKALYGDTAGNVSSAHNLAAYEMLKERNISGGQVPASCWSTSDIENYIKTAKKYVTDNKVGAYFIPNSYTNISLDIKVKKSLFSSETISLDELSVYRANDVNYENTTTVLPGVKTTLRELVKASTNECDLLKKGVFYLPQADEPGNNAAKQLQNVLCQNVISRCIDELLLEDLFTGKDKVKESLKKVGYIVTSYPRDYLNGSSYQSIVSVTPKSGYESICACCYCATLEDLQYQTMKGYCPTYDSYQYDIQNVGSSGYQYLMDHVNDPDFTIWWYSCIQPITPYPSMFVNANLIQKRVNTWTMYQMGIEGELYYMCNRTQEYTNSISIPRSEEEILAGKATYEGTYGDGNLLYPVHRMLGEYDPSLYWLSSLRLDNIAESIDDYNYIAYANELINSIPNSESYKNQLDDLLDSVNDGPGRNTTDIDLFNRQRIALGNLVAELANK